ncbi:uncharacterized protein LOC120189759 [Hibiscus syriacus]|uniref:uncharacterized protein LOC120189759 n=1 Tax=Hibiscus syriacus TaxID=106335 RepID=UPI001920617A|nr:uncharacterized protein LOC120189759 [Hibiscus syriacus]
MRVLWDDTITITMLNYWVKYRFIDIYVEHEVDTPVIVDDILLIIVGEGNDKGEYVAEIHVDEGEGGGDSVVGDVVEGVDVAAGEGNDMGVGVSDCAAEKVAEGEGVAERAVVREADDVGGVRDCAAERVAEGEGTAVGEANDVGEGVTDFAGESVVEDVGESDNTTTATKGV